MEETETKWMLGAVTGWAIIFGIAIGLFMAKAKLDKHEDG